MGTAGAIRRGPMVHYSNNLYAGVALSHAPRVSTNIQLPSEGTVLQLTSGASQAPTGIQFQTLPNTFISNQSGADMSSVESSEDRQTFTLSHLSARIEPDGYALGSAAAVNVVSGDIQAFSYTAGDNRYYNPFSPAANLGTVGTDASTWLNGLPLGVVQTEEVSVDEWKKGDSLHVFAVPNTSTALGAWPACVVDPNASGGPAAILANTVESPQIGFIITGAQPGQRFTVHWKCHVTAYGVETFDESAESVVKRKPVDSNMLGDTLMRTLPQQAKPVVLPDGKGNPAGVAAFAQHISDTTTSKSSVMPLVKTAAKVAEAAGSSGIVDVIADIGLGLLAMF